MSAETLQVAVLMPDPAAVSALGAFRQASAAPPSVKLTVPVGEGTPATPVVVAVKVSMVPKAEGVEPLVSANATVGAIFATVCRIDCAVAVEKLASPEKTAPIVSEPALSAEVVQIAFPLESTGAAAQSEIVTPFDVNAAVPVGAFGVSGTPES